MSDKKPAPAEQKSMVIEGVTLGRFPLNTHPKGHPFARFSGKAPDVGSVIQFTLENGVTYSGVVASAVESGGEVIAEFANGIAPLPQK